MTDEQRLLLLLLKLDNDRRQYLPPLSGMPCISSELLFLLWQTADL
eukprot:CAMPEP_0195319028 /NCGR_PEP_ID=MMETSP0708-20121125/5248_1 /TAXON_ID=33640 /ORGANISM="Asterionellopsis glacialis, Strain CCMP134" /LENGTH=45 /DNA_ID= /DNA_START= /DNA_END= /DNA_ORIENTATION=